MALLSPASATSSQDLPWSSNEATASQSGLVAPLSRKVPWLRPSTPMAWSTGGEPPSLMTQKRSSRTADRARPLASVTGALPMCPMRRGPVVSANAQPAMASRKKGTDLFFPSSEQRRETSRSKINLSPFSLKLPEVHLEGDPEDARLVDEACQVVEVDAAFQVLFVRDVTGENRKLPLAVVGDVAGAQSGLEDVAAVIFGRLVEEEV